MFSFFRKSKKDPHKRLDALHSSLDDSFSKIKEDMNNVGEWIKHLDEHKSRHNVKIEDIDSRLTALEQMLQELQLGNNFVQESQQLSKQERTVVRPKQLSKRVQTAVQTDIQTMLISLTPMERTVVWALLNTDMKLSYSDLSNLLGKDESTVRGQITNIKRKVPGLLLEVSESNGKKRFVASEEMKERIMAQYAQKRAKKSKK